MSHISIIISRARPFSGATEDTQPELSYTYSIPVPHDATPQQVGEMVRKAYRRLEGDED